MRSNRIRTPYPQNEVFRRGSKTYFHSSFFFPRETRREVAVLYGFVRVADDLVDATPAKADEFFYFCEKYRKAWGAKPAGDPIIDDFVELARRKHFEPEWTEAFLKAMEADLHKKTYDSLDDLLTYIRGSAEVIGLFLCRILGLPCEAETAACSLGRSLQYVNILRDLADDYKLGRRYLPLENTSLTDLGHAICVARPEEFRSFVRDQAKLYYTWQAEGAAGYRWLPQRYLVPIKTASDLHTWTVSVILRDPSVVWRRVVKPSKARIFATALKNLFYSLHRPRLAAQEARS